MNPQLLDLLCSIEPSLAAGIRAGAKDADEANDLDTLVLTILVHAHSLPKEQYIDVLKAAKSVFVYTTVIQVLSSQINMPLDLQGLKEIQALQKEYLHTAMNQLLTLTEVLLPNVKVGP